VSHTIGLLDEVLLIWIRLADLRVTT